MTTLTDKAAAERERKANIRRGKERLAALDGDVQQTVLEQARIAEEDAREQGDRRASWQFLADALDAEDERMHSAHLDGTAKVPDLDKIAAVAEATVDLDDPASVAAGVEVLATGLVDDLRDKVRAARTGGLTLLEIRQKFNLHPKLVKELLGDLAETGAAKSQEQTARQASRRRPAREVRGDDDRREEKCPACGKWHDARLGDDGDYIKDADYRKGRADCRACYNLRWREGVARRKNTTGK